MESALSAENQRRGTNDTEAEAVIPWAGGDTSGQPAAVLTAQYRGFDDKTESIVINAEASGNQSEGTTAIAILPNSDSGGPDSELWIDTGNTGNSVLLSELPTTERVALMATLNAVNQDLENQVITTG
jgi:hypothetical protein